jgi:mannose-6-phosphate isomerase-like protein (cupin superfamily)
MKFSVLILGFILSAAILASGDGAPSKVTYVSHNQLTALFVKGGGITAGDYYSVGAMHRSASGAAEMHDKQTDVYYVEEGQATLVTGGTLIGDKIVSPGQHQGSSIEGGETHHLSPGDVVVIPAGVPHWFKAVERPVNYLLVKANKP